MKCFIDQRNQNYNKYLNVCNSRGGVYLSTEDLMYDPEKHLNQTTIQYKAGKLSNPCNKYDNQNSTTVDKKAF